MNKLLNNSFNASLLLNEFAEYISYQNGNKNIIVNSISTFDEIKPNSVVWINYNIIIQMSKQELNSLPSCVIITEDDNDENFLFDEDKYLIIFSKKPRLLFVNILNKFFLTKRDIGIHPTSIIGKNVKIGINAYIGPFCIIEDNVVIGNNFYLEGQDYICSNVKIGNNVIIQSNTKIGSMALNYTKDFNDELIRFPSLGQVIIEDNVDIGSNVSIIQSGFSNTIIGEQSKINGNSFIGSSVVIGKNNYISAAVIICGSVVIGDNNFIGAGSIIRNKMKLGNENTIGAGAVVVSSFGDNNVLIGNPAKSNNKSKGIKL
jgi:UDP-3-O-[3-hydroxymyristoyl] glucosamine N-acyltransferase